MPELVRLRIDGELVEVRPGTSVAAALQNLGAAARTSVTGEPRAPFCGMGTCHECRVVLDGRPHVRACLVECANGMDVVTGGAEAASRG